MGVYGLTEYFREQFAKLPIPKPNEDVSSKTFMVTGSNVGLGFEASVHLARMRPKALLVTCRSQAKCEQTRESILERVTANGVSDAQVHASQLEMGSFQNVRAFVDKFAASGSDALNVLVANAGIVPYGYTETEDGWEEVIQVNYLSTALLSLLLLPYLVNSSSPDSPSRLVFVSSWAHYQPSTAGELKGVESWSNILEFISSKAYPKPNRYAVSKLLALAFLRELTSRLPESTPLLICGVSPGFCKSSIFRTPLSRVFASIVGTLAFIRTSEEGSRTLVHAAVAGDRSMHGRYLASNQVTEESDFLLSPEGKAFSARVWDETIALLSGIDGRVSDTVEKYLQASS